MSFFAKELATTPALYVRSPTLEKFLPTFQADQYYPLPLAKVNTYNSAYCQYSKELWPCWAPTYFELTPQHEIRLVQIIDGKLSLSHFCSLPPTYPSKDCGELFAKLTHSSFNKATCTIGYKLLWELYTSPIYNNSGEIVSQYRIPPFVAHYLKRVPGRWKTMVMAIFFNHFSGSEPWSVTTCQDIITYLATHPSQFFAFNDSKLPSNFENLQHTDTPNYCEKFTPEYWKIANRLLRVWGKRYFKPVATIIKATAPAGNTYLPELVAFTQTLEKANPKKVSKFVTCLHKGFELDNVGKNLKWLINYFESGKIEWQEFLLHHQSENPWSSPCSLPNALPGRLVPYQFKTERRYDAPAKKLIIGKTTYLPLVPTEIIATGFSKDIFNPKYSPTCCLYKDANHPNHILKLSYKESLRIEGFGFKPSNSLKKSLKEELNIVSDVIKEELPILPPLRSIHIDDLFRLIKFGFFTATELKDNCINHGTTPSIFNLRKKRQSLNISIPEQHVLIEFSDKEEMMTPNDLTYYVDPMPHVPTGLPKDYQVKYKRSKLSYNYILAQLKNESSLCLGPLRSNPTITPIIRTPLKKAGYYLTTNSITGKQGLWKQGRDFFEATNDKVELHTGAITHVSLTNSGIESLYLIDPSNQQTILISDSVIYTKSSGRYLEYQTSSKKFGASLNASGQIPPEYDALEPILAGSLLFLAGKTLLGTTIYTIEGKLLVKQIKNVSFESLSNIEVKLQYQDKDDYLIVGVYNQDDNTYTIVNKSLALQHPHSHQDSELNSELELL